MSASHSPPHLTPSQLRTGLLVHAVLYVIVNLLLLWLDLRSSGDLWFYWPLLGWGIGLAWHAWVVNRHARG
jgi:hypothetical protein